MKGYYEIIIIYDKDCGDVICFRHNGFVNDENDIVTQAVKKGFLGEESCALPEKIDSKKLQKTE